MEFKRPPRPVQQQNRSHPAQSQAGPQAQSTVTPPVQPTQQPPVAPPPIVTPPRPQPYGLAKPVRRPSILRRWWFWLLLAVILLVSATVGGYAWYQNALSPKDTSATEKVRVVIEEGSTTAIIADKLEAEGIIRSAFAFGVYARSNTGMQAGGYALSPSMSVAEIVQHLVSGEVDDFQVTFIPGSTIWDIEENLIESGYTTEEVESALTAQYNHPVLAGKPPRASLEGYIYPDTYQVTGDATVQDVFELAFDELYNELQENDIEEKLNNRDMTLYEGITLASIVQKEVSDADDQRQVAQVFLKRLADGMPLGADATFIYGAQVLGVEPRVTVDSPYNTRQVNGLPPGPISNVTIGALQAVVNPAEGDFVYFVSGDDGVTHFTRTEEEHEAATARYCHENCNIFRN